MKYNATASGSCGSYYDFIVFLALIGASSYTFIISTLLLDNDPEFQIFRMYSWSLNVWQLQPFGASHIMLDGNLVLYLQSL